MNKFKTNETTTQPPQSLKEVPTVLNVKPENLTEPQRQRLSALGINDETDAFGVTGFFLASLDVKEDDVIISVGGGSGASSAPELVAAKLGAKVICVTLERQTEVTTARMAKDSKTKHPVEELWGVDFLDYQMPPNVKGVLLMRVIDTMQKEAGVMVVRKALN